MKGLEIRTRRSIGLAAGLFVGVITLSWLQTAPANAQLAPAPTDGACARLAGMKIAQTEILSATSQQSGAPVAGARGPGITGNPGEGAPVAGLPAFCRVVGRIRPEPGSNIRFEVWLPAKWDGRLSGVGIGGFAGSIDYMTLGLALKAGQAGVATDTGHQGNSFESAWAKGHPERVRDYGWRAIHLSTVAAKQLITVFYRRGPDRSYFIGCSGGGRQGLVSASRYPDDYDGILAGAPAANFTELMVAMINPIQAQLPEGAAIRPEQAKLIQTEVLKQCDAADGQADGLVADPRQCRFDVSKLMCGISSSAQCLTQPQLQALTRIQAGPRDKAGRQLAGGYLASGSEPGEPASALGWDAYLLSQPGARSQSQFLVDGALGDLIGKPFATAATFNFDKDPVLLKAALGADLDASPNLSRFFARGGKLIYWHGWADAAIPPEATLRYRDAMLRASGPRATSSSRLFMVPGVQHCMGGNGPMGFSQLNAPQSGETAENSMSAALQAWVEQGRVPNELVAHRGFGGVMGMPIARPERQRLLCAWPAKPVLRPGTNPDLAASYTCTTPPTGG